MAAPLNPAAITVAYQRFRAAQVWTGYGLTEASAISGVHLARGPEDEALFRPLPGSGSGSWTRRPSAPRGRP